jgi:hypothetical protein
VTPERTWLPLFGVAAVLLAVVGGGLLAEKALATAAGPPVGVANAVSVRPLSGWRVAGRVHVRGIPDLRITRGNGNLDVLATSFSGGSELLVRGYLRQVVAPQAQQLQVSAVFDTVRIGHGVVAVRGRYIGLFGDRAAPIEGEVTGLVVGGEGILFDGWAPEGLFQYVQDDIHTMIDRARIP